jgi:hypothetical protein
VKKPKSSGRQYSVMLPDEMVAFVTEYTNIDSVSVAVRALIRKAMKEAPRSRRKPNAECATQNA